LIFIVKDYNIATFGRQTKKDRKLQQNLLIG